jgi:hypothetical protein
MITQHTLDDTLIGTIVGPADGYITRFELVRSQSPAFQLDSWQVFPFPHGSFAFGGKFVLRDGDGQGQRLLMFNPSFGPTPVFHGASLRFYGGLVLENCPRGAQYRLDVSDQPIAAMAA